MFPSFSNLTINTGVHSKKTTKPGESQDRPTKTIEKLSNSKQPDLSTLVAEIAVSIVDWARVQGQTSLAEWNIKISNGIEDICKRFQTKHPGIMNREELERLSTKACLQELTKRIKQAKTSKAHNSFEQDGLQEGQSGVVCIEILDDESLGKARSDLKEAFNNFREFVPKRKLRIENGRVVEGELVMENIEGNVWKTKKPTLDNDDFLPVGGSFGALSVPSSFHNPFVRRMRRLVHYEVLKSGKLPIQGRNFEQVADRLLVRRPGKSPTAEAWHRDEAMFAEKGDDVYGGWLNLDTKVQYFSFVPNTAFDQSVKGLNRGFAPLSEHDHPYCLWNSVLKEIKPGHLMLFNERTIHEVLPNSLKETTCRLFFGWRLTYSTQPLTPGLEQRLRDQEALPIKSGQHPHPNPDASFQLEKGQHYPGPPPMWPKLYWTNNPNLLESLAQYVRLDLLQVKHYSAGSKSVQKWPAGVVAPKQFIPSLRELNFRMYDEYTDEEKSILTPRRNWKGLLDRSGNEVDFELPELVDVT